MRPAAAAAASVLHAPRRALGGVSLVAARCASSSSTSVASAAATSYDHVSFVKEIAATDPPEHLNSLLNVLHARGEKIVSPGARRGLIPLVVPLSESPQATIRVPAVHASDAYALPATGRSSQRRRYIDLLSSSKRRCACWPTRGLTTVAPCDPLPLKTTCRRRECCWSVGYTQAREEQGEGMLLRLEFVPSNILLFKDSKESFDPRWRPGTQWRRGRGSGRSYSSNQSSNYNDPRSGRFT